MEALPHNYHIEALAANEGIVITRKQLGEPIAVMPPRAFDGPGDLWSPEELLTAAVADCFILTFRALAKFHGLNWQKLTCRASGTLDKKDGRLQFTHFGLEATLEISDAQAVEQGEALLRKAETTCLVSNSLKATCELHYQIKVSEQVG